MKKHTLRTVACVLLVGTVLAAFAAIATELGAGSQDDPLVTLSYLNEKFRQQILEEVDIKLNDRNFIIMSELQEKISDTKRDILMELGSSYGDENGGVAISFSTVTLSAGQALYGNAGCEVLLRSGSASCISEGRSVPGLVDTTDSTTINDGVALTVNHLYMMTDQRGVLAGSDVVLLVRGEYMIR